MQRPLMMRMTPVGLRTRLFYHLYRHRRERFAGLFQAARLHYAPQVSMRLMPTDEGHGCIALTGVYELDVTRRLVAAARGGGTLVDVGANYGYYSLLWAAQRPANRVVAFEASPRNFAHIEGNISRNGLGSRIELHRVAIGRNAGSLQFDVGPQDQSGWGGLATSASSRSVEVQVLRLDELWSTPDDIDVLKIDVEGADTWVLQGAEQLLRAKRIKAIFYEQNIGRMRELNIGRSEAGDFLRKMSYAVEPLTNPTKDLVEYWAYPDKR
ncbi:MAG: FkbM family methyltransferase [Pseudomonadota bacterium]